MNFKMEKNDSILLIIAGLTPLLVMIFYISDSSYIAQIININKFSLVTALTIMSIRISMQFMFFYYLRKLWILKEGDGRKILNIKNLFSWQFLIMCFAKILDFGLALYYKGDLKAINTEAPIYIIQIRWIIMVINVLPTFALFLYVVFQRLAQKTEKKVFNNQNYVYLILIIYSTISVAYIIFTPNYDELVKSMTPLMLPLLFVGLISLVIIWGSPSIRTNDFNAPLAFIAFILYLISSSIRSYVPVNYLWMVELIDLIVWTSFGLSFYTKPYYAKSKKKPIKIPAV